MRSFPQLLVALTFSLLTSSTYADDLSPRYNGPPVKDCSAPERVTVTVTAPAAGQGKPTYIAPVSGNGNQAHTALGSNQSKPAYTVPASAAGNSANGVPTSAYSKPAGTALASGYSTSAKTASQQYPKAGSASGKPNTIPSGGSSGFDRNVHAFTYSYDHGGYHFGMMGSGQKTGVPATKSSLSSKSPSSLSTPKLNSTSYSSYTKGTTFSSKVSSATQYNSTSVTSYSLTTSTASYSNTSSTTSQISSTSVMPANFTTPSCQPDLQLNGASEFGFNAKGAAFAVKLSGCSQFDVGNTTVFGNFAPIDGVTVANDSISFPGFFEDYVLLSIFALDTFGNPVLKSYQLHFGSINMPLLVLGPDSQPASGALVYGNATAYPGVSIECTTDASGKCSFINLPSTTIGLVAKTASNSIAVNGLAATSGQVTLQLLPFTQPAANSTSSFDINNGTSGWTAGVVSQSLKIKRDTTLTLDTNHQYTVQSASNSFNVHPFTKEAYIKYKFITSEVPGGYFGTQYNDYYSVTIRSDTGALVTVTNSMNALGLGAFDSNGATDWFTLTLTLPADSKSVEYDIAVSNVADNLLDSQIIVAAVGDLQCDKCGDCASCPGDPMCQATCTNPPYKSCDFYRNCAEAQLDCGPSGYPLAYGEKNCNRFVNNLKYFSPSGQDWIFNTMHCLQTAMVPVLQPCTATCPSFQAAAFASHPGCYVDNGFCGLQCPDILATMMTVNTDLLSLESLKQVAATSGLCLQNMIQTLTGCTGDIVLGSAVGTLAGTSLATKIALTAALALLKKAALAAGS